MQFGPLQLKRCRYGWMLFAGPYIGKCFELYGQYSEAEIAMMRLFLREGGTVIDVGGQHRRPHGSACRHCRQFGQGVRHRVAS